MTTFPLARYRLEWQARKPIRLPVVSQFGCNDVKLSIPVLGYSDLHGRKTARCAEMSI